MYIPALDLKGSETTLRSASHAARDPDRSWPPAILKKLLITYQVRGRSVALVTEPNAVKTILCSGEDSFPKWLPIYRTSATRHFGPNSILAVQGELWSRLRTSLNPIFAPDRADLMIRNAETATVSAIRDLVGIHSMFPLGNRIAIDVMWRTVMGDCESSPSDRKLEAISDRMVAAYAQDDLSTAAICISDLAATISTRMPGPAMPQDHPFRHLTAEGGINATGLSDDEIRENLSSLMYAGQETTSVAVAWTLWILGQDQDLQDKVRREIATVPRKQLLSRSGLLRLTLLNCVLKESMRLLPPAMVTVRRNTAPMTVAGTELPAGTILVVPFYALHRNAALWEEPNVFRPSRFGPGSPEPRHSMTFIPFSSGRHTCIAAKNSMFELMAILATIIRDKQLVTQSAESVTLYTNLTLRPSQPLLVDISSV